MKAFTLIELIVTCGILSILCAFLFSAISHARPRATKITCANNLRQLGFAAVLYTGDFDDALPPRVASSKSNWVAQLLPYYEDTNILRCATEQQQVNRTYILNAFNDWFKAELSPWDYYAYEWWSWPKGLKVSVIPDPSDTILFGEKRSQSSHIHLDLLQGGGNDLDEIDYARHSTGSNFLFADGSVQWLQNWDSIYPVNLWAITEEWRHSTVP